MEIAFDPDKSAGNNRERGLPFELTAELEWDCAFAFADDRADYGETRMIALVPWRERLPVVCYLDQGEVRRIISFRKANKREEKTYDQATADR